MSIRKSWFFGSTIDDIISVSCLEPIGPITWLKLYNKFPTLKALLETPQSYLEKLGLNPSQCSSLANRPQQVDAALRLLESRQINVITIEDEQYPSLLKEINDPPLWLFYKGSLDSLQTMTLTVVGTRKPSNYALTAIKHILSDDLISQLTIASGLAYGIDKAAHELALNAKTKTVAILAGGLDTIYPTDHYRLADKIVETGGALISEYPPLSRPRPWKFPVRNRILAGLAPATLIVEAAIKSGSLTTAKSALEYNRDILAVPSEITRKSASGTNFLIKHGATLVDCTQDIATLLQVTLKKPLPVDKNQVALLDLIADNPLTVDSIVELTHQPIEEILGLLTQLELTGTVHQSSPGHYQKTK